MDSISAVTAAMQGGHVICVRCTHAEQKTSIFQQHDKFVKAAGITDVNCLAVNKDSPQEWHQLKSDLGALVREYDFLRVGTVLDGTFKNLRAVGIGPNKIALPRALNIALALSVIQRLRVQGANIPQGLRPLLCVEPMDCGKNGGNECPPPVKAKPPIPPYMALPAPEVKHEPTDQLDIKQEESPSEASESEADWLPEVADRVAQYIMPSISREVERLVQSLTSESDEAELFVDEVFYSQQSCCDQLRNGKVVAEEVEKIVRGEIDPLKEEWLKLEVFYMKSLQSRQMKYYSSDNRRLLILRRAQERLYPQRLKLRATVKRVPSDFRKFLAHFNTETDGKSIRVKRRGPRKRRRVL